ncbi:MAG: efflux RND transporter permease subunit, partial [Pirellulales bacterium]
VYVSNVASVQFGPAMRRASLEKNGNEAVGGVVLMRYGENPLQVTNRIKKKIGQLQAGLPQGVRIVPFYERTELIENAIHTVSGTLREEMIVASLAILLILWHVRSALIICITLPMAVLTAFILMRFLGIPSNIMSLSGIVISIGVLVDSSIVMVENATHHLHRHFGRERVQGDTKELVLPGLRAVGRPIFFSVMIMLISFIPVFALGGMEGRMFHPLAWTKTFAMVGVSILAITLVPALIPLLVRGRLRGEEESWIVRSVLEIYRPVLNFLLEHPWPIVLLTGLIFVVAAVPVGIEWLFRLVIGLVMVAGICAVWKDEDGFRRYWHWVAGFLALLLAGTAIANLVLILYRAWRGEAALDWGNLVFWSSVGLAGPPLVILPSALLAWLGWLGRGFMFVSVAVAALLADTRMSRLGSEFMPPLDEGTVLDMPVTIPRASITQVSDDLKARDALLRSFPEVEMVVGKAGRAETPTDPAPPDMIETVVNLRPREHWPKRELRYEAAHRHTEAVLKALVQRKWLKRPSADQETEMANDATMFALETLDQTLRSMTFQDYTSFQHQLAPRLTRSAVDETVRLLRAGKKLKRDVTEAELAAVTSSVSTAFGPRLVESPDLPTIEALAQQVSAQLAQRGFVEPNSELLLLSPSPLERIVRDAGEVLGVERPTLFSTVLATVESQSDELWLEHVKQWNWHL